MANTASFSRNFSSQILSAQHKLSSASGHEMKLALYYSSGSLGSATTAYTATAEVTGTNYTAGGVVLNMSNDPATSGSVGYWTPGSAASWGTLTAVDFNAALLWNNSHASSASVAVYTFGNSEVTAGNFSLTMPANTSAAALVRIAFS